MLSCSAPTITSSSTPGCGRTGCPPSTAMPAPRVIEEDGREYWVYEDTRGETMGLNAVVGRPRDQLNPDPIRFSDMRPGCYDPVERAKDMLADGILASRPVPDAAPLRRHAVPRRSRTRSSPTCASRRTTTSSSTSGARPVRPACSCRRSSASCGTRSWPRRRSTAAPTRGRGRCRSPRTRCRVGLPSYWDPYWDPVWRAAEERDVVLCLHIGTSGQIPVPSPGAPDALSYALLQVGSMQSSVNLMMSPVCRNFPGLKFVFSEGGIGWLPNALERADRMWLRHKAYNDFDDTLPSEIFRQNMYLCMIEEPICLKYRDDIGVDQIMWECDYPHTDTVWPESQESAQDVFDEAGCTPDEIDAITHGNAERVFNWTMAAVDLATA